MQVKPFLDLEQTRLDDSQTFHHHGLALLHGGCSLVEALGQVEDRLLDTGFGVGNPLRQVGLGVGKPVSRSVTRLDKRVSTLAKSRLVAGASSFIATRYTALRRARCHALCPSAQFQVEPTHTKLHWLFRISRL
jgi:hypothetical protein